MEGWRAPRRWQETLEAVFAEQDEALQATWDALEANEQAVMAALRSVA